MIIRSEAVIQHKSHVIIFLVALSLFIFPSSSPKVLAQENLNLTINEVNTNEFPKVVAHLTVADATGLPVEGLVRENFSISEDSRPVPILSVQAVEDPTYPINIVLAIDVSGSMNAVTRNIDGVPSTALEDSKEAAISFIDSLGPNDQVSLVTFSFGVMERVALTIDKDAVKAEIQGLEAKGGTALYDAIIDSVGILKKIPAGRKAVVVLADGADSNSSLFLDDAIDEATRWSIPIYPIGFGNVNARRLVQIATFTGGYSQIKPDSSELVSAFEAVLAVLRHQYVLTFESQLPADDLEHSLTISIDYAGGNIEDSQSFVAQSRKIIVELEGIEDGDAVGGDVRLRALISPPSYIRLVTFSLDGSTLTTLVDQPFEFIWDSMAVPEGEHQLTITAEDVASNIGILEMRLVIRPPIRIKWINPVEEDVLSGSQSLTVEVDALKAITLVEFFIDGELVDSVATQPYEISWDSNDIEPGEHVFRSVAYDVENNSAEESINVSVGLGGNGGILAIAILVLVGGAAIMIPWASRRRRRLRQSNSKVGAEKSKGLIPSEPILHELEGYDPGHKWKLGSDEIYIGRKRADVDIPAKGRKASRRHAVIRLTNGVHVLHDLNPSNPSIINGAPSPGQHTLMPGDTVQIGTSILRFEMGEEE